MANFIACLFWLILALIHLAVFYFAYKIASGTDSVFASMWSGIIAGATGAYFYFLLIAVFISSAFLLYGYIAGIPIWIAFGIIFTSSFWSLNKKYNFQFGIFLRAFLGLIIGAVFGLAIGWFIPDKTYAVSISHFLNKSTVIMMSLLAFISSASAIVIGKREVNW